MGKAAEVDDRPTRALLQTGLAVTPMARGRGTVRAEAVAVTLLFTRSLL